VLQIAAGDGGLDEAGFPEEIMWLGLSQCSFKRLLVK
jgi:hypothetical protein